MADVSASIPLHEKLRQLMPSAQAESARVVATFIDIRGFSGFASSAESFDSALYLRSVYSAILDRFFSDVSYFKPTGDGLMIIHEAPGDSGAMKELVGSILHRSLQLVDEFPLLTDDDLMVNFPVPQDLGVGIARGTATRLVSEGIVLDYTGRCLNLAARLMDKARPRGVVFSDRQTLNLIDAETLSLLVRDEVCIRGIAEQEPVESWLSIDVILSQADREPIADSDIYWGEATEMSVEEVRGSAGFGFYMSRRARSSESAGVHVAFPTFDGLGSLDGYRRSFRVSGTMEDHPEGVMIRISFASVREALSDTPETYPSFFLKTPKSTQVTFTPFFRADSD